MGPGRRGTGPGKRRAARLAARRLRSCTGHPGATSCTGTSGGGQAESVARSGERGKASERALAVRGASSFRRRGARRDAPMLSLPWCPVGRLGVGVCPVRTGQPRTQRRRHHSRSPMSAAGGRSEGGRGPRHRGPCCPHPSRLALVLRHSGWCYCQPQRRNALSVFFSFFPSLFFPVANAPPSGLSVGPRSLMAGGV